MEKIGNLVDKNLSVTGTGIADAPTVIEVSDVSQPVTPLPEVPCYEAIEALIKKPVFEWQQVDTIDETNLDQQERAIESCSLYRGQLVAGVEFHPFVVAIHLAFSDHRPLCLSPDMMWLLIMQGLANHINANAEQLRSQFVKHESKVKIVVRRDDFVKGSPENPWTEAFREFSAAIRQHLGDATHDLFVPNFSTTGLVEKAAAEVVLLDAMQSYFDYELWSRCGIPRIKLEGTVADWRELLDRTKRLAQFELQWWIEPLIPILEQFVLAVYGKPDQCFWQSIYKFESGSGGTLITGWITAFFPYLQDWRTKKASQQNRWLVEGGKTLQELLKGDFLGVKAGNLPSGLAKTPFVWHHREHLYNIEFLGGFIGVKQNLNDLFLRPEIGWAVREAATL